MRRDEKKGGEVKRVQGTREQRERGVYVARTSFLTFKPPMGSAPSSISFFFSF
jgi:hypothetical protein